MVKFKITKGVTPPRRGPKFKIAEYAELFPLLAKMEPGDSIQVVKVPATRRNSTYLTVKQVLQPKIDELGGGFRVASANLPGSEGETMTEIRIYRIDNAATKGVKRRNK